METGIIKREFSPELTEFEKKVVEASRKEKVKDQPRQKLQTLVATLVTSVIIILGHSIKLSDNERQLIEREIVNDIWLNFKFLTYDELRLIFSLGARGEYKNRPEDIVYFSVATVYNWLKSYVAQTKREAMQKQARFEQDKQTPKPPTEEEKKKMEQFFLSEYIIKPYNEYLKTGEYIFDNRGNVIYNTLDKMKVIPFSVERKKEIFERAKAIILEELSQWIGPEIKTKIQNIRDGSGPGHEEVKSLAKEIALKEFFEELRGQEMSLEDFIELRK
jgi:hypothetical protein